MKTKRFRIRTKRFFLTYPSLPLVSDLEDLALTCLEDAFGMDRTVFGYIMCTEQHEDGTPHLHVYLEFDTIQTISNQNKLDITLNNKSFHGNYQAVKSKHNTIQYIIKAARDTKINKNIELPIYNNRYFTNINKHLSAIIKNEGMQTAVNVLYNMYPEDAIKKGSSLLCNLKLAEEYYKMQKMTSENIKYKIENFANLPDEINAWITDKEPLSLLLYGPTGKGKTELAKAIMLKKGIKSIFIRNKQALKLFKEGFHYGLIFDDIDLDDFNREELIHIFDVGSESQLRILYGFVSLPAGLCKIFTTNNPSRFLRGDPALTRRLIAVHIDNIQFINLQLPSSNDDNLSPKGDNVI